MVLHSQNLLQPPSTLMLHEGLSIRQVKPQPAQSVACPEGVATGPRSAAFGLLQNWLGGDPGSLQPTLCQQNIAALGALSLPPNVKDDSGFSPLLTRPKETLCPSAALMWCSPAEHHLPQSSPGCTQVMPLPECCIARAKGPPVEPPQELSRWAVLTGLVQLTHLVSVFAHGSAN